MNYSLPEEIIEDFDVSWAYQQLMDKYIKRPFGYKKALSSGKLHRKYNRKAFDKIYALYPELTDKPFTVHFQKRIIELKESPAQTEPASPSLAKSTQ